MSDISPSASTDLTHTEVLSNDRISQRRAISSKIRLATCNAIFAKMDMSVSSRLMLRAANDRIWEAHPTRTKHKFSVPGLASPWTLDDIIRSSTMRLGDKVKRILAVHLAYATIYFDEWLDTAWTTENILFHKCGRGIPLRPYVLTNVRDSDKDENHSSASNFYEIHPFPGLVILGRSLIELHTGISIDQLANLYGIEHGEENINSKFTVACDVFERCRSTMFPPTIRAVQKCLDFEYWVDLEEEGLSEQELRKTIYRDVMTLLEDELAQGYGEPLVDKLDELAGTLDLSRLGQEIADSDTHEISGAILSGVTSSSSASANIPSPAVSMHTAWEKPSGASAISSRSEAPSPCFFDDEQSSNQSTSRQVSARKVDYLSLCLLGIIIQPVRPVHGPLWRDISTYFSGVIRNKSEGRNP